MKSLFGLYATVLRAKSLHQLWASFPHNTWKTSLANFEPETPEPRNEIFFLKNIDTIYNFLYTYFANNCTTFGTFSEFCGDISSASASTVSVHVWGNTVTYIV